MGKRKQGIQEIKEGAAQVIKNSGTKKQYKGSTAKGDQVTGKQVETTGEQRLEKLKGYGKMLKGAFHVLFNHPEWYTNYDLSNLVGANFARRKSLSNNVAANMGYVAQTGETISFTNENTLAVLNADLIIPKDSLLSFNQAISIMYSKIRSANAGAINYTPLELAKYVLNVRSLRAMLAMASRAVGLSNYVSALDADLPGILTSASMNARSDSGNYDGVTYDAILKNKADFTNLINAIIRSMKVLVPLNIPLFDRTDWMFGNVFKDSNDAKANYYLFTLGVVPEYDIDSSGNLQRTNHVLARASTTIASGVAYDTFVSTMFTLLNGLTSGDVNTFIAGDILKAYGEAALYHQSEITADYVLEPIYDEAALTQIQNTTIVGATTTGVNEVLNANSHTLSFNRDTTTYDILDGNPVKKYINFYKDSISSGELISATRFATLGSVVAAGGTETFTPIACGSEVITHIDYITGVVLLNNELYGLAASTNNVDFADLASTIRILGAWSNMDYSPMLRFPIGTSSAYNSTFLFDFNNYALVDAAQIDMYHQIATLSLLYTPSHVERSKKIDYTV